jgi:hypothetical protein
MFYSCTVVHQFYCCSPAFVLFSSFTVVLLLYLVQVEKPWNKSKAGEQF